MSRRPHRYVEEPADPAYANDSPYLAGMKARHSILEKHEADGEVYVLPTRGGGLGGWVQRSDLRARGIGHSLITR